MGESVSRTEVSAPRRSNSTTCQIEMPSWCALSRRVCSNFGREDFGRDDFGGEDLGGEDFSGEDFSGTLSLFPPPLFPPRAGIEFREAELRRRLSIAVFSGTGCAGRTNGCVHECENANARCNGRPRRWLKRTQTTRICRAAGSVIGLLAFAELAEYDLTVSLLSRRAGGFLHRPPIA